jgi:hypothetical protein
MPVVVTLRSSAAERVDFCQLGQRPATVGERVGWGVTLLIKVNLAAGSSEKHASTVDVRGEHPDGSQ